MAFETEELYSYLKRSGKINSDKEEFDTLLSSNDVYKNRIAKVLKFSSDAPDNLRVQTLSDFDNLISGKKKEDGEAELSQPTEQPLATTEGTDQVTANNQQGTVIDNVGEPAQAEPTQTFSAPAPQNFVQDVADLKDVKTKASNLLSQSTGGGFFEEPEVVEEDVEIDDPEKPGSKKKEKQKKFSFLRKNDPAVDQQGPEYGVDQVLGYKDNGDGTYEIVYFSEQEDNDYSPNKVSKVVKTANNYTGKVGDAVFNDYIKKSSSTIRNYTGNDEAWNDLNRKTVSLFHGMTAEEETKLKEEIKANNPNWSEDSPTALVDLALTKHQGQYDLGNIEGLMGEQEIVATAGEDAPKTFMDVLRGTIKKNKEVQKEQARNLDGKFNILGGILGRPGEGTFFQGINKRKNRESAEQIVTNNAHVDNIDEEFFNNINVSESAQILSSIGVSPKEFFIGNQNDLKRLIANSEYVQNVKLPEVDEFGNPIQYDFSKVVELEKQAKAKAADDLYNKLNEDVAYFMDLKYIERGIQTGKFKQEDLDHMKQIHENGISGMGAGEMGKGYQADAQWAMNIRRAALNDVTSFYSASAYLKTEDLKSSGALRTADKDSKRLERLNAKIAEEESKLGIDKAELDVNLQEIKKNNEIISGYDKSIKEIETEIAQYADIKDNQITLKDTEGSSKASKISADLNKLNTEVEKISEDLKQYYDIEGDGLRLKDGADEDKAQELLDLLNKKIGDLDKLQGELQPYLEKNEKGESYIKNENSVKVNELLEKQKQLIDERNKIAESSKSLGGDADKLQKFYDDHKDDYEEIAFLSSKLNTVSKDKGFADLKSIKWTIDNLDINLRENPQYSVVNGGYSGAYAGAKIKEDEWNAYLKKSAKEDGFLESTAKTIVTANKGIGEGLLQTYNVIESVFTDDSNTWDEVDANMQNTEFRKTRWSEMAVNPYLEEYSGMWWYSNVISQMPNLLYNVGASMAGGAAGIITYNFLVMEGEMVKQFEDAGYDKGLAMLFGTLTAGTLASIEALVPELPDAVGITIKKNSAEIISRGLANGLTAQQISKTLLANAYEVTRNAGFKIFTHGLKEAGEEMASGVAESTILNLADVKNDTLPEAAKEVLVQGAVGALIGTTSASITTAGEVLSEKTDKNAGLKFMQLEIGQNGKEILAQAEKRNADVKDTDQYKDFQKINNTYKELEKVVPFKKAGDLAKAEILDLYVQKQTLTKAIKESEKLGVVDVESMAKIEEVDNKILASFNADKKRREAGESLANALSNLGVVSYSMNQDGTVKDVNFAPEISGGMVEENLPVAKELINTQLLKAREQANKQKQQEDAVQKSSTTEVLPGQPQKAGEAGSEGTGMESSVQGEGTTQEGGKKEVVRDEAWDENAIANLPESSFPDRKSFKEMIKNGVYGMLTAWNPQRKSLSDEENAQRNEAAKSWLEERGYSVDGAFGKYGNSELSFFVPNLSREDAIAFAVEFDQESVATHDALVYQDGSYHPRIKGAEKFDTQEDFYSVMNVAGKRQGFSIEYDFDTLFDKDGNKIETSKQEDTQGTEAKTLDQANVTGYNISDSGRAKELSKLAKTPYQKRIVDQAVKALKTLKSILPNWDIIVFDNENDFANYATSVKANADSRGLFTIFEGKGVIAINLESANLRTVAHEMTHAVLFKMFGDNPKLFAQFKSKIAELAKGKKIKAIDENGVEMEISLDEFAEALASDEAYDDVTRAEEYVSELTAVLSQLNESDPNVKSFLKSVAEYINQLIAKYFGPELKPIDDTSSPEEIMEFFQTFASKVYYGQEIKVGEADKKLQNNSISSKAQSVTLANGKEAAKKIGLVDKFNNVRQIAEALEGRQRKKYGIIEKNDFSKGALDKISSWMGMEVKYFVELMGDKSGKGWYGKAFQDGMDNMSQIFPELKSDQNARDLFTMLVAITSDGEKVKSNFKLASIAYDEYRKTGKLPEKLKSSRPASINGNLAKIQNLLNQYNGDASKLKQDLLVKKSLSELNKERKAQGLENIKSDWPAVFEAPLSASVFGPKLGMFYANLSGQEEYPTLDRWWSRTFNRYRGTLIPSVNRGFSSKGEAIGIDNLKALAGDPNMTDDQAIQIINEQAENYKNKGWKNGTELEKAANTLFKVINLNINDAPFNKSDRQFMYDAFLKTTKKLNKEGYDLSIADVQAILWYYEKNLYKTLGARGKIDGVSYGDVAQFIVDKYVENNNSFDFSIKKSEDVSQIEEGEEDEMRTDDSSNTPMPKSKAQAKAGESLVDQAKLTKHMTEDGQGNYLFYHYSPNKISSIDPKYFGKNTARTGRDERPGLNISMYYTRPDVLDVSGKYGYVVRIPKDLVYPFNEDPLNLYDAAKETFEKMYPGQTFDPNKQAAFIAQEAAKLGYPMIVVKWGKDLRAETTEKMKGEFYQRPDKDYPSSIEFNPALEMFQANEIVDKETKNLPKSKAQIIGTIGAARMKNAKRLMYDLDVARMMEKEGKSKEEIRIQTNWERGADDLWRIEAPDGNLKTLVSEEGMVEMRKEYISKIVNEAIASGRSIGDYLAEKIAGGVNPSQELLESGVDKIFKGKFDNPKKPTVFRAKLTDIFDAPEIYKAYGSKEDSFETNSGFGGVKRKYSIKDIVVEFDPDYSSGEAAIYYANDYIKPVITLSSKDALLTSVLIGNIIHELQHYIQGREFFEQGANPESITDEVIHVLSYLQNQVKEKEKEIEGVKRWGEVDALSEPSVRFIQSRQNTIDTIKKRIEQIIRSTNQANAKENAKSGREKEREGVVTSASRYEYYESSAGETEARNAARRSRLSDEEKMAKTLESTEDIARKDQLLLRIYSPRSKAQAINNKKLSYVETLAEAGLTEADVKNWKEDNAVSNRQERNPDVQEAAVQLKEGKIKSSTFIEIVRKNMPIIPMLKVPKLPTIKEIISALKTPQVETGIVGLNIDLQDGTEVALRLDIPAYNFYDTWVVSIHESAGRTIRGKSIGYGQTAVINNVTFGVEPLAALNIAIGKQKNTIARIYGDWINESPESVHARAEELMNDPNWVQVGMNPFRHSFFYDKADGMPVVSAEEVVQVGALVLAKNVVKGTPEDSTYELTTKEGVTTKFQMKNSDKLEYVLLLDESANKVKKGAGILNTVNDLIAKVRKIKGFRDMSAWKKREFEDNIERDLKNKLAEEIAIVAKIYSEMDGSSKSIAIDKAFADATKDGMEFFTVDELKNAVNAQWDKINKAELKAKRGDERPDVFKLKEKLKEAKEELAKTKEDFKQAKTAEKNKRNSFRYFVKEYLKLAKLSGLNSQQISAIVNRATGAITSLTDKQIDNFMQYVDKIVANKEFAAKMDALSSNRKMALKRRHNEFTEDVLRFLSIPLFDTDNNPLLTDSEMDRYLDAVARLAKPIPDHTGLDMSLADKAFSADLGKKEFELADYTDALTEIKAMTIDDLDQYTAFVRAVNKAKRILDSLYNQGLIDAATHEQMASGDLYTMENGLRVYEAGHQDQIDILKEGLTDDLFQKIANITTNDLFVGEQKSLFEKLRSLSASELMNLDVKDLLKLNEALDRMEYGFMPEKEVREMVNRVEIRSQKAGLRIVNQLGDIYNKLTKGVNLLLRKLSSEEAAQWEDVLGLKEGDALYQFVIAPVDRAFKKMSDKVNQILDSYYKKTADLSFANRKFLFLRDRVKTANGSVNAKKYFKHRVGILSHILDSGHKAYQYNENTNDWLGNQLKEDSATRAIYDEEGVLNIVEDVYNNLLSNPAFVTDGKLDYRKIYEAYINDPSSVMSDSEQKLYEAFREANRTSGELIINANAVRGVNGELTEFYSPRRYIGKGISEDSDVELGYGGAVGGTVRSQSSYSRVSKDPAGPLQFNVDSLVANNAFEAARDFYISNAISYVNDVFRNAREAARSEGREADIKTLNAIQQSNRSRVDHQLSRSANNFLTKLTKAFAAKLLIGVARSTAETLTNLGSGILRTVSFKGLDPKAYREATNLMNKFGSPVLNLNWDFKAKVTTKKGNVTKNTFSQQLDNTLATLHNLTAPLTPGEWMSYFRAEFKRLTGEDYSESKHFDDNDYRYDLDRAASFADQRIQSIKGGSFKGQARTNYRWIPDLFSVPKMALTGKGSKSDVGRGLVSSNDTVAQMLNLFNNFVYRDVSNLQYGAKRAARGITKDDRMKNGADLGRGLFKVATSSASLTMYVVIFAVTKGIQKAYFSDDDKEKKEGEETLEMFTNPDKMWKMIASMGINLATNVTTSRYGASGRAMAISMLQFARNMKGADKQSIDEVLQSLYFTEGIDFEKYDATEKVAALLFATSVPPVYMLLQEAQKLYKDYLDEPGHNKATIYDLWEEGGKLFNDETADLNKMLSAAIMATNLILAIKGKQIPFSRDFIKSLQDETAIQQDVVILSSDGKYNLVAGVLNFDQNGFGVLSVQDNSKFVSAEKRKLRSEALTQEATMLFKNYIQDEIKNNRYALKDRNDEGKYAVIKFLAEKAKFDAKKKLKYDVDPADYPKLDFDNLTFFDDVASGKFLEGFAKEEYDQEVTDYITKSIESDSDYSMYEASEAGGQQAMEKYYYDLYQYEKKLTNVKPIKTNYYKVKDKKIESK